MNLDELINDIPLMAVEAVCVARRNPKGEGFHVVWVNDSFCEMFVTSSDAIQNTDPFAMLHWDYVADFKSALEEMDAAGETNFSQDTLCLRSDGSSFWGGVSFVRMVHGEPPEDYTLTLVRNIDTLKNREQSAELALIENEHLLTKLEAVQTRLMSAITMSPDPFCIYDARDRLVIWNPAFAKTVAPNPDDLQKGMLQHEILDLGLANGFIDDAIGREEEFRTKYLAAWHKGGVLSPVVRIRGRDYKVIRSESPNGDRVFRRVDISEHLRQQRELQNYAERLEVANREISEQALHDELTGLGNRRYLNTRLEDLKDVRRNTGLEIAALHTDLDRFKQINDTMGHAVGDHVLKHVADILRTQVREEDVVARIGGDEFVVLTMCAPESENPDKLAGRLIDEICRPIPYDDRLCRIGASVGIARTPVIAVDELIACSDIALYKAKTGGRAMKATFDHRDLDALRSNKRLSDDIFRGLDAFEFIPLYQPQVNLDTGDVVAFEVIACWQHPERGLLPMSEFASTAMEVQADRKIEGMVFQKAIEECRRHFGEVADMPVLGFNVGLSRLMDAALLADLDDLRKGELVVFELNETVFLEDLNASILQRFETLRDLGISLEVDDFGSGRASIVGLRQIAPQRLKIDRHLIEPIATSEGARRLVRSIIDFAGALNIGITADGITSDAQVQELLSLGCRRGQGPFFARPGPLKGLSKKSNLLGSPKVA
ncbi:MAG: EAL domain-containing protein [Pseudomonadota bacterium]